MTEYELDEVMDMDITERWPLWNPTDAQVSDLRYALKRYDKAVAKEAIRKYALETSWNTPKLKDLISLCRQIQPTKQIDKTKPEPSVYIKCVGKDEDGNGPVGRFSAIEFRIKPLSVTHDPQVVLNVAHRAAAKSTELCGGQWQVLQDTTYDIVRGYTARQKTGA